MNCNSFHKFSSLIIAFFILIFAGTQILAANGKYSNDKTIITVANDLSNRLKRELVQEKLSLDLTNVEKKSLSNNEVYLNGSAFCVLEAENTKIPINFEAKFNMAKQSVEEIKYTFVDSEYAPVNEEELLMQHLLKRISQDYKTENLVIAIDGFDASENLARQKEFKGSAEIRIGDVEWKKIDFDVLTTKENSPLKVAYNIKN